VPDFSVVLVRRRDASVTVPSPIKRSAPSKRSPARRNSILLVSCVFGWVSRRKRYKGSRPAVKKRREKE